MDFIADGLDNMRLPSDVSTSQNKEALKVKPQMAPTLNPPPSGPQQNTGTPRIQRSQFAVNPSGPPSGPQQHNGTPRTQRSQFAVNPPVPLPGPQQNNGKPQTQRPQVVVNLSGGRQNNKNQEVGPEDSISQVSKGMNRAPNELALVAPSANKVATVPAVPSKPLAPGQNRKAANPTRVTMAGAGGIGSSAGEMQPPTVFERKVLPWDRLPPGSWTVDWTDRDAYGNERETKVKYECKGSGYRDRNGGGASAGPIHGLVKRNSRASKRRRPHPGKGSHDVNIFGRYYVRQSKNDNPYDGALVRRRKK